MCAPCLSTIFSSCLKNLQIALIITIASCTIMLQREEVDPTVEPTDSMTAVSKNASRSTYLENAPMELLGRLFQRKCADDWYAKRVVGLLAHDRSTTPT